MIVAAVHRLQRSSTRRFTVLKKKQAYDNPWPTSCVGPVSARLGLKVEGAGKLADNEVMNGDVVSALIQVCLRHRQTFDP